MKQNRPSVTSPSDVDAIETGACEPSWRRVVKRRAFLHGVGAAAATLPAAALFVSEKDHDRDDRPVN